MDRFDEMLLEASGDLVDYKFMKKDLQKVTPWGKVYLYICIFLVLNSFLINLNNEKNNRYSRNN